MLAVTSPRRRVRDFQAETGARNVKRKGSRFYHSMDGEEQPSPSLYNTRSRTQRPPSRSRPTSLSPNTSLEPRERCAARQQPPLHKIPHGGSDWCRTDILNHREPEDFHDSGFVLGDADDDQRLLSPPHSLKRRGSLWRKDWLETRTSLTRNLGKVSCPDKCQRNHELYTSYSKSYLAKEREDKSRTFSKSSNSDLEGDGTENNNEDYCRFSTSQTSSSSESSATSTQTSSFSADGKEVLDHSRAVPTSRTNVKAGRRRRKAEKSLAKLDIPEAPDARPATASSKGIMTGTPPSFHARCAITRPRPPVDLQAVPIPPPELASKSASRIRRPVTRTQPQQRSRPPRQIRLKMGRWTKEEDEALFRGVVEYLAQHGLEPKPPAHLPIGEDSEIGMVDQEEKQVERKGDHQTVMQIEHKRLIKQRHDYMEQEIWSAPPNESVDMAVHHQGDNDQSTYNQDTSSSVVFLPRDHESDTQLFEELINVPKDDVHAFNHCDKLLIPEAKVTKQQQATGMKNFLKGFSVDRDPVLFGNLLLEDQLLSHSTTSMGIVGSSHSNILSRPPSSKQVQHLQKSLSIDKASDFVPNQDQALHPSQNGGPETTAFTDTPSRSAQILYGNYQQGHQQHQLYQQHIHVQQHCQQQPQPWIYDSVILPHQNHFMYQQQQQQQQLHAQEFIPSMKEQLQQYMNDSNLRPLQQTPEGNLNRLLFEHGYQHEHPNQYRFQQHPSNQLHGQHFQHQQYQDQLYCSRDQNLNPTVNPSVSLQEYQYHHLMVNRPTHYSIHNYNQHPTTVVTSLPFWGGEESKMMTVRDTAGKMTWPAEGSESAGGGEIFPVMGCSITTPTNQSCAAVTTLVTARIVHESASALEAMEMALFDELLINNSPSIAPHQSTSPFRHNNNNSQQDDTSANVTTNYETYDSYTSAISRRLQSCPWSLIASLSVPGRTGVQAQARYSEALDPLVKKGPWSAEEDALLMEGVGRTERGRCWIWIADGIRGRTQRQCRTRWVQLKVAEERRAALQAKEVLRGVK